MEYVQLTLKIPVPGGRWFRFRIRSLLLLMVVTALISAGWSLYHDAAHSRLMQNLTEAKLARDEALQNWKRIFTASKPRGAMTEEATARARYFESRAEVEKALQRLVRFEKRIAKTE
jgi:hypothetical protein